MRYYTREAGVRNLEREIANLTRKAVQGNRGERALDQGDRKRNFEKYAGIKKFRYGKAELEDLVGVVTGLAWTEVGGELLSD